MAQPLMPHATAAWLVENSSLTFEQIAEFCGLHILEVQAIADDTAATKLTGRDPIRAGELTHEEIEKGQADPDYALKMHKAPDPVRAHQGPALHAGLQAPGQARRNRLDHQEPSRSHRRPDQPADRHHAHDHFGAIRDRSHWNMANITPKDPVTLGLTSQRELDAAVAKAAKAAGIAAPTDTRFEGDREALIERASRRARAARPRCRGGACRRERGRRRRRHRSRASATRSSPSDCLDLRRGEGQEAGPWMRLHHRRRMSAS